jgi:hypothetical protein
MVAPGFILQAFPFSASLRVCPRYERGISKFVSVAQRPLFASLSITVKDTMVNEGFDHNFAVAVDIIFTMCSAIISKTSLTCLKRAHVAILWTIFHSFLCLSSTLGTLETAGQSKHFEQVPRMDAFRAFCFFILCPQRWTPKPMRTDEEHGGDGDWILRLGKLEYK